MMTVIDANILPIIIALLAGFIVGWWMFKRRRAEGRSSLKGKDQSQRLDAQTDEPAPPPVRPYMQQKRPIRDGIDTIERRGIADEGATAMRDVASEMLGVSEETAAPAEASDEDDLQLLKGVGPKLAQKLKENGIFRFDQLPPCRRTRSRSSMPSSAPSRGASSGTGWPSRRATSPAATATVSKRASESSAAANPGRGRQR
jgi:hypothetical protein